MHLKKKENNLWMNIIDGINNNYWIYPIKLNKF